MFLSSNLQKEPEEWSKFRRYLAEWRTRTQAALKYEDKRYRDEAYAWASSCFSCCFLMLWDEDFFDPRTGVYMVDAFLRSALEDYGGFDSLVLWQAYPRLGADDRNQFDFYRDMPGGIEGLRSVVRICHASGVKTFLVYNPWDTGTRREGVSDDDALVSLVKAIEADGVFLDTMAYGSVALRSKLDEAGSGLILEGEDALPLQRVHDHSMSWAQQFRDSVVPGVLKKQVVRASTHAASSRSVEHRSYRPTSYRMDEWERHVDMG